METNTSLAELLQQLEEQLRTHQLWQEGPPPEYAYDSKEPFSIDLLQPHEWLQWIFIARIRVCMSEGLPTPRGFMIEPYFSEAWKDCLAYSSIIETIKRIDNRCK